MNIRVVIALVMASSVLAGCGGETTLRCDEHTQYKLAVDNKRLDIPEGLTAMDSTREMALPEPSPHVSRPDDAGCLDLPPTVIGRD